MKLDDRIDALGIAKTLLNAPVERIAAALLEAHLEGLQQARGQINQTTSTQEIAKALDERCKFIRAQLSTKSN